jgi:ATP/maltotriose-dependent transcriptional regulator MalT
MTTALQQWLVEDDRPSAWITLDEADNDPAALAASLANGFHPKRVMSAAGRAPRLAP